MTREQDVTAGADASAFQTHCWGQGCKAPRLGGLWCQMLGIHAGALRGHKYGRKHHRSEPPRPQHTQSSSLQRGSPPRRQARLPQKASIGLRVRPPQPGMGWEGRGRREAEPACGRIRAECPLRFRVSDALASGVSRALEGLPCQGELIPRNGQGCSQEHKCSAAVQSSRRPSSTGRSHSGPSPCPNHPGRVPDGWGSSCAPGPLGPLSLLVRPHPFLPLKTTVKALFTGPPALPAWWCLAGCVPPLRSVSDNHLSRAAMSRWAGLTRPKQEKVTL